MNICSCPTPGETHDVSLHDVDALAEALGIAGVERGHVGAHSFRRSVAARFLTSDWLTAHDAEVRRDTTDRMIALAGSWESAADRLPSDSLTAAVRRNCADDLRGLAVEELT